MVDEFVRLLKSYPVGENDRISHSNASLQCLALVCWCALALVCWCVGLALVCGLLLVLGQS